MRLRKLLFLVAATLTLSCSSIGESSPEKVVIKANNVLIKAAAKGSIAAEDLDLKNILMDAIEESGLSGREYDEVLAETPYIQAAINDYGDTIRELYCANGAELSKYEVIMTSLTHSIAHLAFTMNSMPLPDRYEIINSAILQDGETAVVEGMMCFPKSADTPTVEDLYVLKRVDGKWKIDVNLSDEDAAGYSAIISEYRELVGQEAK